MPAPLCARRRRAALPLRIAVVCAIGACALIAVVALGGGRGGAGTGAPAGLHTRRRLLDTGRALSASSGNSTDCAEADARTGKTPTNLCYPIKLSGGGVVLYIVGVLYLFVGIAIVCDEYFVPALEKITEAVGVSDDVAGATFMAAGGSAPELFTSLIGTFSDPPSAVGFGTIVGSAVFNVLFVIGMCAVFSKEVLELTWWPLARDASYYTVSLIVLALLFNSGRDVVVTAGPPEVTKFKNIILLWEAIVLLVMYAGYVVLMKYNARLQEWVEARLQGKLRAKVHSADQVVPYTGTPGGSSAGSNRSLGADGGDAGEGGDGGKGEGGVDRHMKRRRSNTAVQASAAAEVAALDVARQPRSPMPRRRRVSVAGIDMGQSQVQLNAFLRPATFRGGVLQLLISQKGFMDRVSRLVIAGIKGNVEETFAQIDTDSSGMIDKQELKALLDILVYPDGDGQVLQSELDEVLKEVDLNNDGSVSLAEFRAWYNKSEHRVRHEMKAVFDSIDLEHSGEIWKSNVKQLLERLQGKVTDQEVEKMWCEATGDTSGDATTLTLEQFQLWYEQSLMFKQKCEAGGGAADDDEESHLMLEWPEGTLQRAIFIGLAPIMFSLSYTVPDVRHPDKAKWYPVSFLLSILWIGVYSFFMVEWATLIGSAAGIPPIVMGLTFLAAGTSIPDLLTSVIVARQGLGDMAVSSSIGSNIFDVLVGLPLPWFLYCVIKGKDVEVTADSLFLSIVILIAMLVCVILVILASGWKMTKSLGYSMFVLYGVFVAQQLLREYDAI